MKNRLYWLLIRRIWLRLKLPGIFLHWTCLVDQRCILDKYVSIGPAVCLHDVKIGAYSYVGGGRLQCADIGRFTSIGPRVYIGGFHRHSIEYLSSSPIFSDTRSPIGNPFGVPLLDLKYENAKRVIVGNDVWVGADVRIFDGVSIGDGAVVAAGAVVVKNVPKYAIVGGVPARILGYRFSDELMRELDAFKWWALKDSEIRKLMEHGLMGKILSKESLVVMREVVRCGVG